MPTIKVRPIENQKFEVSLVDANAFELFEANTTFSTWNEPHIRTSYLFDVGEAGYEVLQPIPYTIERIDDADFIASVESLNVATGGTDWHDAYQALVAALLDTFDALRTELNPVGQDAASQLAAFNAYLVKTDNA